VKPKNIRPNLKIYIIEKNLSHSVGNQRQCKAKPPPKKIDAKAPITCKGRA
jgi:hypothetical protein